MYWTPSFPPLSQLLFGRLTALKPVGPCVRLDKQDLQTRSVQSAGSLGACCQHGGVRQNRRAFCLCASSSQGAFLCFSLHLCFYCFFNSLILNRIIPLEHYLGMPSEHIITHLTSTTWLASICTRFFFFAKCFAYCSFFAWTLYNRLLLTAFQ